MTAPHPAAETFTNKNDWLAARGSGIGSSDAPVILGLSKWKSPLSLYHEKRGMREESPGESEFREWGLALEPAIIDGYRRVTGRSVASASYLFTGQDDSHRFTLARDPAMPFLVASPDATVRAVFGGKPQVEGVPPPPVFGEPGVLEVKNVDISKGRDWEDAQEPPLIYQVQVQHQLMVTGAKWASIAALVGGNRFMWADIQRDDDLIAMLRKLEVEFWQRVESGDPPPVDGSDSTKELLARLYPRDVGGAVELPIDVLEWDAKLEAANAALKAAEAARQEAQNHIRACIGEASVGVLPGVSYSWKWQQRKEHVVKASEFRVLRRHADR